MKTIKTKLITGTMAHSVSYLFQTLLVTYLVLLLVEQIWTGVVSVYLNLNYLLIIVLIAGILDVFSEHDSDMQFHQKGGTKRDYLFIVLLGITGSAIIKYKTAGLGWLSYMIALIAGVLIVLLSILVLDESKEY